VLLQAFAALAVLPILLRVVRVQRLTGTLGRSIERGRSAGRVDEPAARRVARVVAMAARHTLAPNTCLHRSLALWWLLGRRGLDSQLKMGARLHDGRLDAHAWVEHDGIVVNDDPEVTRGYTPLSSAAAKIVS
jgi:hypothetical protein